MYILCYLFDNDELSIEELKNSTEETAQYILHAVGLVMHRDSRRFSSQIQMERLSEDQIWSS